MKTLNEILNNAMEVIFNIPSASKVININNVKNNHHVIFHFPETDEYWEVITLCYDEGIVSFNGECINSGTGVCDIGDLFYEDQDADDASLYSSKRDFIHDVYKNMTGESDVIFLVYNNFEDYLKALCVILSIRFNKTKK